MGLVRLEGEALRAHLEKQQREKAARDASLRADIFRQCFDRDGPLSFLKSEAFVASAPEREWLVPGVVAAGTPGLLFGAEKSFKTTVALDLAISGATGTPFLGSFETPKPFRSMIISAESGAGVLSIDGDSIARSKGTTLAALNESIAWSSHRIDLTCPESVDRLNKAVWAFEAKLLVIDPIYQCLGVAGDMSNIVAMGKHLAPFADIAKNRGCAVLLIHHALKGSDVDYKPPKLSDVNGAGFGAWAAQWLMLKPARPRSGSRFNLWLSAGCRGAASVDRVVEIDRGETGAEWNVVASTPDEWRARQQERREAREAAAKAKATTGHKAAILDVLSGLSLPETKRQIRERSKVSTAPFERAWAELQSEGLISSTEIRKNGRKETGWSLAEAS